MAPRPIDDSAVLVEIAIESIYSPDAKFALIFRSATARVPAYQHSDESARRRLQRKFDREKSYWIERGRQEIADRRAAQYRRLQDQLTHTAEQMRPIIEAANAMMERYRPAIEAANAQMNSPAMRQALEHTRLMLERVQCLACDPSRKQRLYFAIGRCRTLHPPQYFTPWTWGALARQRRLMLRDRSST